MSATRTMAQEAAGDKPAASYWVCDPCGKGRTEVSLREPRCRFCGRKYDDDLRRQR